MSVHSVYLHRCLDLFATVTEIRYGKRQRLEEVERDVQSQLADHAPLWKVVRTVYDSTDFDADVFGPLHERIGDDLKRTGREWQSLPQHQLIEKLYDAFRQIEPVSVVMRFICPRRFGIMSPPVATLVGVRPRRKATATYKAYVKSLREIGRSHGFERAADVEMALWALQVGALDGRLPQAQREPLEDGYNNDRQLRQLTTRNLTKQLFAETGELDVAEALLDTKPALAGKIAGIEFEQLVSKRVLGGSGKGVERSVSLVCCRGRDERLGDLIKRFGPSDMSKDLDNARGPQPGRALSSVRREAGCERPDQGGSADSEPDAVVRQLRHQVADTRPDRSRHHPCNLASTSAAISLKNASSLSSSTWLLFHRPD